MKKLIVANWKANTPDFRYHLGVAIAAPFPFINQIPKEFIRCAQDVSQFENGAHTGEVTAEMLASLDVKYCLVGHSERRKIFDETNEIISKKIQRLHDKNIKVILCAQEESEIIGSPEYIMFEPKGAISDLNSYHPENPEIIKNIISVWQKKYPAKFLYGGSVNDENIKSYLDILELDGFVIGQASLDPEKFSKIISQI